MCAVILIVFAIAGIVSAIGGAWGIVVGVIMGGSILAAGIYKAIHDPKDSHSKQVEPPEESS